LEAVGNFVERRKKPGAEERMRVGVNEKANGEERMLAQAAWR
jgi:hypothetical protein